MKHFLTLFASLLVCLHTIAALRTPEEAMRIAASLGQDNQAARIPARQPQDLTHCYTALQSNGDPALYVFNRGEDEGFVLISAEDRAQTVLGYADNGHWDEAHMSDATRMWIRNYCKQISRIASQPANTLKAPVGVKKATQQKQYNAIPPICQTTWGQGTPYNDQCPTVGGNKCVTGCVATAGAQIMKVFEYPSYGTGTHSYEWTRGENDVVQMSETFGATYNWSKMLNDYSYTSGTTTQRNAVATLMYHCGIVSEMQYGVGGSYTSCNLMLAGMVNHFNYDAGVQALIKDCMTDANFVAGIVSELEQGRPVMFSGRTIKDEGHAFIGDGVDADGLIHINWGWRGYCDGYFQVSAMDPEGQGIGGSLTDEAYTEQVVAFTHIRPNVGGSYQYTLVSDSVYPKETVVDRSKGWVELWADTLENTSLIALDNTSSALKVYDENGNFLQYCTYNYSYDGLKPAYYYYSQPVRGNVSSLGVGKYYISPVMKIGSTYVPIQVRGYSDYRCSMQITQNKIYLNAPEPSLVNDIDPTTADYTLLRTYSYPSTINCGHYWTVQLSTASFYNADATDQMLLFLGFTSASPRSIVGSYVADGATNFQLYAASVYQGNVNTYQKVAADDGEVTIVYNSLYDTYTIHYRLVINEKTYVGQATIPSYYVWSGYGEDYLTHKTYDTIVLDNTQYTGITVSQAINLLDLNGSGWESEIPYIIEGEIKSMNNTPAQMVNYGNCRLYLTDGQNELYGYNTKWLHEQSFQTGYEIEVGGLAAIIGKLKYYGTTKEINAGYFYQYDAPGTIREYGIMTDAENESYHEVFDSYEMKINALDESGSSNYYAYIIAQQDNAVAKLFLFPAAGVDTLSPGTYVFSDEITPFGAWQGYGVNSENNIIGSYAAHTNQNNSILTPLWYPRSGTVTVNSRGVITVNATNSYGQSIFFRMANLGGRGIEQTQAEDPAAQKILRNGILYIRRNGIEYTIDGGVCGRNTAKP